RGGEWAECGDLVAKELKKCGGHSGHFYYRELRECPWCGIETHGRVRLFNFLISGTGTQRGHFRLDEIWKEIESVQMPDTQLIPRDKSLPEAEPSADVAYFPRDRRKSLIISLLFSAIIV